MSATLACAEVRELDRRAIEEYGIPSIVLMENAGRACADEVERLRRGDGPIEVLVGPGNNGGDGLVIARTLANRGHTVAVLAVGSRAALERASADVRKNLALWTESDALGGSVGELGTAAEVEALASRLAGAGCVVDALFGTGLARELGGPFAAAAEALAACPAPVLAVDLPSGLDGDTGAILGAAVRADVTVTFVARKPGMERGEGPALCGRVVVAEIGIPYTWLGAR